MEGNTGSGIRWEGTEDTVECACPAMMTRWLSHHCATGLPLPSPSPLPPGSPPQDTSEVEGSSGGGGGRKVGGWPPFNLLLGSLQILSQHAPLPLLPKSVSAHPWACFTGGPLISEVMENGPRHTLQIGSDCPGVKGESFMELGESGSGGGNG